MSEFNEIQKLIRLKRYERPPEDYFDDFLLEFQRRQRADMIRRPLWEIALDRTNIWLDGFRVPAIAYASILVVALGMTGLILFGQGDGPQIAAVDTPAPLAPEMVVPASPSAPVATAFATASTSIPPSYVLESRPVSNESPFSF